MGAFVSELNLKKEGSNNFQNLGLIKNLVPKVNGNWSGLTFLNNKKQLIMAGEIPIILSDSNGKQTYQILNLPKELLKGIGSINRKSKNELYVQNWEGIFLWNEQTNKVDELTKKIKNFVYKKIKNFV